MQETSKAEFFGTLSSFVRELNAFRSPLEALTDIKGSRFWAITVATALQLSVTAVSCGRV